MKQLVLIGLMGAGKTTVGRACAERLRRDFVDTDDVVVKLSGGMTVDEIFATGGESHFRQLEKQAVADVCESTAPLVVACGGGTVVDAENRKQLKRAGIVVWLEAPVDVLAQRVGDGSTRPLLRNDPARSLSRLAELRAVAYAAAADARVDTADRSIEDVAGAVLAAYEGATA